MSSQLARPEGTVNASFFYVCLKASSGTRDRTWGFKDWCNLHGLSCQRVACEEKYRVTCFTLVCRQLRGSCQFARPQCESVFLFVCLCRKARCLVGSRNVTWNFGVHQIAKKLHFLIEFFGLSSVRFELDQWLKRYARFCVERLGPKLEKSA